MAFQTGSYAKIKEVEDKGNFSNVKISISKKDARTGTYCCTFSGWVRFVGNAHKFRPMADQRIKLGSCCVTNGYMTSTGEQAFTRNPQFTVFDYELQTDGAKSSGGGYNPYVGNSGDGFMAIDNTSDLPF